MSVPIDGNSLLLERLGPADLDGCVALDQQSFGGWWSRGQWLEELNHSDAIGIGVRRGDDLLAMAWGRKILDELHISLVAVSPSQRRAGLGRLALDRLLRASHLDGVRAATLEVGASNAAAKALYGAAGFKTLGIRRGYYRDGDDALIQWVGMD